MSELLAEQIDGKTQLVLPAKLAMHETAQIRDVLLAILNKGSGVILDFKNVIEIKTPCAQVLVAGLTSFSRKNLSFCVKNTSAPVVALFEDLGISPELKKMESKGI